MLPSLKHSVGNIVLKTSSGLTRIGEKLNYEPLIYHPFVYMGFERAARRNAPPFADAILKAYPEIRSVADVGCGTGGFAAEFRDRGLRVGGCEYNKSARERTKKKKIPVIPFDLAVHTSPSRTALLIWP